LARHNWAAAALSTSVASPLREVADYGPAATRKFQGRKDRFEFVSNVAKQVYGGSRKFIELLLSNSLMN
jgi:hypothetical protein